MKALFRILIITTILTFVFYKYSQNPSAPPPKPDDNATLEEWQEYASEALPRPAKGVSKLIGETGLTVVSQYGQPIRKDPSGYNYEWWVYEQAVDTFMMLAIEDDIVKQVYVAGRSVKTEPFTIGSTLDDVYRTSIIEPEIMLNKEGQLYTLALTDYDLKHRLLVKFDDIVAQVFVNTKEEVTAVRFYDYDTIIKLQPYEMAYHEGIVPQQLTEDKLTDKVSQSLALQLRDILYVQRYYQALPRYQDNKMLHDLAENTVIAYLNHQEDETKPMLSLEERAQVAGIVTSYINEITTEVTFDAIETMHRLLNDETAMTTLLNEEHTQYGIACVKASCTQISARRQEDLQLKMLQ